VSDTSVSGSLVVSFRFMKKPLIAVSIAVMVAFSVPYTSRALTVYQQLLDSSGTEDLSSAGYRSVGSFTVNETVLLGIGVVDFEFFGVFNCGGSCSSGFQGGISTTTPADFLPFGVGAGFLASAVFHQIDGTSPSSPSTSDQFLYATTSSTGIFGQNELHPNETYYIYVEGSSPDNGTVITNLSNDFVFGYIRFGALSVPIDPGIPGYTDVGIATTTQAAYCYTNFSTSTGFLDSIGQSFALAMCNVGVFLFVPSTSALSQFSVLSSTTQSKIPFSYVFDAYDIFSGLTASSTGNIAAMSLSFPDISSSTPFGSFIPTSVVGLSTSTISTYLPESVRLGMLGLQRVALWSGLAFMFYRRIIPHKATV